MAYLYEIPISLFPGGVAPASWEEFADRVSADAGITSAVLEGNRWQPVAYGTTIALTFDIEPTGVNRVPDPPGPLTPATLEKLTIDGLVAAGPDAAVATETNPPHWYTQTRPPTVDDDEGVGFSVPDFWFDSVALQFYICTDATDGAAVWVATDATNRGYFEDFGADTVTTGLAVRMSESPVFLAGRYELGWTSQVDGSTSNVDFFPRFFFDGGLIADADVDINAATPTGFDGRIERVLTAGAKEMRLEIEKIGGTGDARMRYSTLWFRYLSVD